MTGGSGGGEIRIKDFLNMERNREAGAASSSSKVMAFQRREDTQQSNKVDTSRTSKVPRRRQADAVSGEAGILKIKKVHPNNEQ